MRKNTTIGWALGTGAAMVLLGGGRTAAAAGNEQELVVLFDDSTTSLATVEQALQQTTTVRTRGRHHVRRIRAKRGARLSAVTWRVPDATSARRAADAIARLPGVHYANPNRAWRVRGAPRDLPILETEETMDSVLAQSALDQIDAPTGAGGDVKVAVLDGGFDLAHEMLTGHLGAGWDTLDDDPYVQDLGDGIDGDGDGIADDMVGHGTFVSGLITAVAPDAEILPYRVLDDEGWGTDLAVWLAVSRALDDGADVVNMSMVIPTMPQPLQDAIDAARADGVVFVTAAGNEANGPFDDPDLVSRAVVVGGVDGSDSVLSWSPSGTHVEVYAPAYKLLGPFGGKVEDSYATWSGTSFACALVAGAAARVVEADPTLTPAAVESILTSETDAVTGDSSNGRLNVSDAVSAAQ